MGMLLDKIARACNECLSGTEEDYLTIRYGISVTVENVSKIVLMIAVAFLSGRVLDAVLIFGSFCMLRSQAGGIHFKTSLGCSTGMVLMWGISMWVGQYVMPIWLLVILALFVNVTIFLFAPASTSNNPIYDVELRRQKKNRAFFLSGCLSIFAFVMKDYPASTLVVVPMFLEAVSIWALIMVEAKEVR